MSHGKTQRRPEKPRYGYQVGGLKILASERMMKMLSELSIQETSSLVPDLPERLQKIVANTEIAIKLDLPLVNALGKPFEKPEVAKCRRAMDELWRICIFVGTAVTEPDTRGSPDMIEASITLSTVVRRLFKPHKTLADLRHVLDETRSQSQRLMDAKRFVTDCKSVDILRTWASGLTWLIIIMNARQV